MISTCVLFCEQFFDFRISLRSDYGWKFKKNSKISIEVIDVRTLTPIDFKTILKSVSKTKKVLILDPSWSSFGSAAEIMSGIYQRVFNKKKKVLIDRLSYPDSHTPASSALERKFYLNDKKIKQRIIKLYRSEL